MAPSALTPPALTIPSLHHSRFPKRPQVAHVASQQAPTAMFLPAPIQPGPTLPPARAWMAFPCQASYHPLSAQAFTSASASSSAAPLPTSIPHASTTLSHPASSLPLSKPFHCEQVQVPHDPWLLQFCTTKGPGGTAEVLQVPLVEKGVIVNGNDHSGVQITCRC
jgi:hypothetical protein